MEKLFSLADQLKERNIAIILVQIDEAHSCEWPVNIKHIFNVEQPKPQQCFSDRMDRAKEFIQTYNPPYPVYVDNWDNAFAEQFRAWPDKYHFVDTDLKVLAKSEYHQEGDKDALIVEDCIVVLSKLLQ